MLPAWYAALSAVTTSAATAEPAAVTPFTPPEGRGAAVKMPEQTIDLSIPRSGTGTDTARTVSLCGFFGADSVELVGDWVGQHLRVA